MEQERGELDKQILFCRAGSIFPDHDHLSPSFSVAITLIMLLVLSVATLVFGEFLKSKLNLKEEIEKARREVWRQKHQTPERVVAVLEQIEFFKGDKQGNDLARKLLGTFVSLSGARGIMSAERMNLLCRQLVPVKEYFLWATHLQETQNLLLGDGWMGMKPLLSGQGFCIGPTLLAKLDEFYPYPGVLDPADTHDDAHGRHVESLL